MSGARFVHQILSDYARLEPDQSDSWNPVGSKFELGYRLNLFYALTRALEISASDLRELCVLDLGCGNGRSTRMYIDLGLQPDQITGLDLRPGAIALARKLNPAIRWVLHDGSALPPGSNWIATSMVFSSIAGRENRAAVAAQIRDGLCPGGYAFYYGSRNANPYAGGDRIDPAALFMGFRVVWSTRLGRFSSLPVRDRWRGLVTSRLRGNSKTVSLRNIAIDWLKPAHEAFLFQKL